MLDKLIDRIAERVADKIGERQKWINHALEREIRRLTEDTRRLEVRIDERGQTHVRLAKAAEKMHAHSRHVK
ncbi:MAG TPA: hypothetical protein VFH54_19420 [Mycobacteriales bacterium]|nr:hypothetical protein [Mycobacteriales bacterium]